MDAVTNSVSELRSAMDLKVAQAREEIRKLLLTNLTTTENSQPDLPAENEDPEVIATRPRGYQLPTRDYHVEFPKFDGLGLKDWLYKCEMFFAVDGTPEDSKVKLASCKLEGKALQWHQSFMKHMVTREWPRWGEYIACLYARFGSGLFDDPMGDFKDLRQHGSVNVMMITLGDIMWNFKKLKMEFSIMGHKVLLRGIQPPATREATLRILKFQLEKAQNRMKVQANKHKTDRSNAMGDWVYVKLQPYMQLSLKQRAFQKLLSKFFVPFQIIAKVGSMEYTLDLPAGTRIYPTFHISQLKRKIGSHSASVTLLVMHSEAGHVLLDPEAILDRRMI
ncbi:hypothetical protein A4A49_06670 [Nicotiana attenuata]|uniref:Tf2-1-like SH3-like domain-containing protein n=1 Tax=Nicotiana attenuata TaxID=49451 RepID=A0A1J6J0G6_NICAT|nr:hypothetical protein A4A49_06670 [Nicotiana attenuata]